jgi:hypothetical protein
MALEFKSGKTFKFVIGASALFISTMAAVFSVTGVATLFSGYFLTVALMMSGLEFGKVIVASFMARYWKKLNYLFRFYFILALMILITITSSGIFGYLSDGYQKTKGTYDVSEKEVVFLNQKIDMFTAQKKLVDDRINQIVSSRKGQEARLDSLYARKQVSSAKSVESYVQKANKDADDLTIKSNAYADSLSKYSMIKLEKENKNATGELGPLKYLAKIFGTDMDIIVKYFIFMLIFVFDPLAILLFVSLNVIIKNEHENLPDVIPNDEEGIFSKVGKKIFEKIKSNNKKNPLSEPTPTTNDFIELVAGNHDVTKLKENFIEDKDIIIGKENSPQLETEIVSEESEEPTTEKPTTKEPTTEEPTTEIADEPISIDISTPEITLVENTSEQEPLVDIVVNKDVDEVKQQDNVSIPINLDNATMEMLEDKKPESDEHDFYHGDVPDPHWHTANVRKDTITKVTTEALKKTMNDDNNIKTY